MVPRALARSVDSHSPVESRNDLMDTIHITMPDGAIREVPLGTTAAEIAQQISPRLAKEALVARVAPIHGPAAAAASASRSSPAMTAAAHS